MRSVHDRCASPGSVALLILVALAGCKESSSSTGKADSTGGSGGVSGGVSGGGSGDNHVDAVTIGAIPIVDVAAVYLGKAKGFFAARKIDLTITPAGGGATIITGVLSDQLQFGFTNVTSFVLARDKGMALKILANGASSTGLEGKDMCAIVVPGDSPIQSAKDLNGKTVSVNQLNNIGDTTVRASVRKAGGDPKSLKFIEMPFPDAPAALEKRQMDAAFVVEPFVTRITSAGGRVIAWPFVDAAPLMTIAVYFTSEQTLTNKPDLVKRFTEAINESLAYSQNHPDEVREILKTYTKIPPEVAAKITLPNFPTDVNRYAIKVIADLARQDGLVTMPVEIDTLFASAQ